MADPLAPPVSAPLKSPFDAQRQAVTQRFTAQKQDAGDAMSRRFAALGGLSGGASIKAQQVQDEGIDRQKEDAINNVNQAESTQAFQANEAQKGRDLQSQQFNKSFGLDEKTKLGQLDLAQKQFQDDLQSTEFNKAVAAAQAGVPFDLRDYLASTGSFGSKLGIKR